MAKVIAFVRGIVGNNPKTTLAILFFIGLLVWALWRAVPVHAGELDLQLGSSFAGGGSGPVLGLDYRYQLPQRTDIFAGTTLWGASTVPNNWDWHAGVRGCRWELCLSLGAAHMQRTDRIIGSQTDYLLQIAYLLPWARVPSVDVTHRSDAGTTPINRGLQAALLSIRLQ
jgi:hypothetical protein